MALRTLLAAALCLAGARSAKDGACARHADCAAQNFCTPDSLCAPCATATPGLCDTDGWFCCNTTFLQQCSDNPGGCVPRGVPTGGSVSVGQSLLDFAMAETLPLLRQTMLYLDPLDFSGSYDWGLAEAYYSALGVTVEELELGAVAASLTPSGTVLLEVTGIDLSVQVLGLMAVQPLIWPLPDITCTGASRPSIPARGVYPGWDPLPPVLVSGGREVPWVVRDVDPFYGARVNTSSEANTISIELGVGYNRFTGAPTITSSRATCSLASVDIQTYFTTACGWIATFAQFLVGDVERLVCDQLVVAAQNFTLHNFNEMLSDLDLAEIPLPVPPPYDIMGADVSLTSAPDYNGGASPFLSVGLHGEFTNRAEPLPNFDRDPPPAFSLQPDGQMLTAAVSSWTIETLLYVAHRSGLMNATLTKGMLPSAVEAALESDGATWFSIAPQLHARRPPVDMQVLARSAGSRGSNEGVPAVAIDGGLVTMRAPIELIFQVDGGGGGAGGSRGQRTTAEPEELFALACPLDMGLILGVEAAVEPPPETTHLGGMGAQEHQNQHRRRGLASANASRVDASGRDNVTAWLRDGETPTTRATFKFSFARCEVELLRSSVGAINIGGPLFGLQQQLNTIILPALVLYVNTLGAEGVLLPSVMGFSAVNARLDMRGDIAEVGFDLAYQPPPPKPGAPTSV